MARSVFTTSGAVRVSPNASGQQAVRSPAEQQLAPRTVNNDVKHVPNTRKSVK